MEDSRKSQYNGGSGEDALIEAIRQLDVITREPVKIFYIIRFSIGEIKYSIISQQQMRLPGMILSAISNTIEDRLSRN